MMRMSMKTILSLVLMATVATVFAASWPASGSRRDVTTLVVCSNNKSPRLLAEVIQSENFQPYLLLPAAKSDDTRIFFCPAREKAVELTADRVESFVRILNPRRIVVLGNENFVPRKYLNYFDRNIPVFVVDAADWNRVADELEFMLNVSGLSKDYRRLRAEMFSDAKLYRPISKPAPKTETVVVDDKVAVDGKVVAEDIEVREVEVK